MLEIRLEQRSGSGNPFLRAHLGVGEGRNRTGLARELVPKAGALHVGRCLAAVGSGQHTGELIKPPVLVGPSKIKSGIPRQGQDTDARGQVRRRSLHPPIAVSASLGLIFLRQPLAVEYPVAQPEHGWHKGGESLSRDQGMIAQPPPAHAFRQDVTGFGPPVGVGEVNFEHPLEPGVKFLVGALVEGAIHPLRRGAGQYLDVRVLPPLKILGHQGFDRLGVEQLVFVIVLGFEEHRANAGPG